MLYVWIGVYVCMLLCGYVYVCACVYVYVYGVYVCIYIYIVSLYIIFIYLLFCLFLLFYFVLFGDRAISYSHPDSHSIPVGGGNAPDSCLPTANKP